MTETKIVRPNANDHKDVGIYGVHISGVDDIYAAHSRRRAFTIAAQMNSEYALHIASFDSENEPILWASPVFWPYSEDNHAQSLKDQDPLWQNWPVG